MSTYSVNKVGRPSGKDLNSLSSEELIEYILRLEAYNNQLKCIIAKKNAEGKPKGVSAKRREIDHSVCPSMQIALRILYLGWNYQGLAVQDDTNQTIEHHLMEALTTCQLIESRQTANYSRCGRTDKGVSAFSQVVSIKVRRKNPGDPHFNYIRMLNRLLPKDIRVLSWAEVAPDWSARFNCTQRSYKYFFPKGDLDLKAMNEAAGYLVGHHDFRNLCKMDVANGVTAFERTIFSASVSELEPFSCSFKEGYKMCQLLIEAKSFLWHQVRAIAAILLLVGKGFEEPSIIKLLLDVESHPRKPQYPLAGDLSLNLFACEFDGELDWQVDPEDLSDNIKALQEEWARNAIKSTHILAMLDQLESSSSEVVTSQPSLILRKESKTHIPLLSRPVCSSLEDRIDHFVKKRRIQPVESQDQQD